ncbi:MAG: TetR/AcrR family transcriptional regulator [bacterium]|jgi:AcrR family transcriptional regulator|nr:TetR/AcrR family transcriptional regulator [bacterium]
MTEPSPEFLARRAEIVEVAANVFRARGYDAGSLGDVAVATGLRKASLYYYVRSKSELLYLVFDRAITIALRRLTEIEEITDPRERLAALIRHQVATVAAEPSLFTVFFDQRPGLEPQHAREIGEKERQYVRVLARAVSDAIAAGTVRNTHARYGAQGILGMASWVYKWLDPARDDPEEVAEQFVLMVLGPPPG